MKTIVFNFKEIHKLTDFYTLFQKEFDLPSTMATNLDGLWDAVTGIIELPVKIEFHDLTLESLDKYKNLISLMEEAEAETEELLLFSYFLEK